MFNFFKKIINAVHKTGKAEIEEIQQLKVTKEDKEQAEKLSKLIRAGMIAAGVPCPALANVVMEKVLSYGIRDLKDGIEVREKLIINRLIKELS